MSSRAAAKRLPMPETKQASSSTRGRDWSVHRKGLAKHEGGETELNSNHTAESRLAEAEGLARKPSRVRQGGDPRKLMYQPVRFFARASLDRIETWCWCCGRGR
jgi:hypothetical protein